MVPSFYKHLLYHAGLVKLNAVLCLILQYNIATAKLGIHKKLCKIFTPEFVSYNY
jgi:hypothetical protein